MEHAKSKTLAYLELSPLLIKTRKQLKYTSAERMI